MKYIKKRSRPRELYRWHLANAKIPDARYGSHKFPTDYVHRSLLREQGGICAYTMIRIDAGTSHIEHLKPQAVSRAEGKLAESSDYQNMVACYPQGPRRGDPPVTFGAIFRKDAWDAQHFITPLTPSCESKIRFGTDGRVRPHRSNDEAARWTIGTLGLDNSRLTELRVSAIEGRGLSLAADEAVTRDEAQRVVDRICQRDNDGLFCPYCVAIKHAAEEYIKLLDKAARRRKYALSFRKKGRR